MAGQNLTREEAEARSSIILDAHYRVDLDLTQGDDSFTSVTELDFSAHEGSTTFIDLIAERVLEITLNGQSLDLGSYHDSRIVLPNLASRNQLRVVAECFYMHTGEGLHRFTDPQDGKSYVYSQFEVPDSRRVFAVFEQPDIKADFTFTLKTPADWKAFSNSPSPQPQVSADGLYAVHRFSPTEKISSYVTAVVAGPYVGDTGSLTSIDGREIPLGVYCRASMYEYLDAEEIMDITRAGFDFYENAFERPYPFRKYDQIFVPEFNAGAMENAGCVTFRDEYVFRSRPLEARVERRAVTILHELAHMWFGDLVTMKWWNDLWLNESFAEYMSTVAVGKVTRWKDVWTTFSSSEKAWAYRQDQLPSTHPIVAQINDLQDVQVNFDGITYAKGACVLSQLVNFVGWDNFRAAIRRYFAKHEWGNATLEDLLGELEAASGRDLGQWSNMWLKEAGMTWIRPILCLEEAEGAADCCGAGDVPVISSLRVEQEVFTSGASLRLQRMAVRAYDLVSQDGQTVFVGGDAVEFDLSGEGVELDDFVGKPVPDVLLVNDRDLGYGKVRLDSHSLKMACDNIEKFTDSLPRSQVLAVLWDMVRDGEVSASEYVEVALRALTVETHSTVVQVLLNSIHTSLECYVHPSHREELSVRVGDRLARLARVCAAGSDAQLQLVRAAARRAASEESLESAKALLDGTETLAGLHMDAEMRWNLLISLAVSGWVSSGDVEAELRRDDTVNGRERALEANAALPEPQAKAAAFERAYADEALTNDQLGSLIAGFSRVGSPVLLSPFAAQYFDTLLDTFDQLSFEVSQSIIEGFYPQELVGYEDVTGVDVLGLTQSWLDSNAAAPAALRRMILEGQSRAERISRAQARDLEG